MTNLYRAEAMPQMPSNPGQGTAARLVISRRRAIAYSLVASLALLAAVELGVRIGGYVVYGFSPYYLFYGWRSWMADADPQGHTGAFDGYFKFPPSRTLRQYGMFTEPTPIRINALGFRGPDFAPDKLNGTYRIISVGESSTFGFYNRDDQTYPAILGGLFAERQPSRRVEVINAGIPHANSDNMLAMVRGELLSYRPNIITIYAGYNDAAYLIDQNALQRLSSSLHKYSATYVALKRLISSLGGPALHSRWATYVPKAGREHVRRQIALHVSRYRANIQGIIALARQAGATVVLIKQPMTTSWSADGRVRGLQYQEELRWVQDHLERQGWVTAHEALFLVQGALMETLQQIAAQEGVPLVDNTAIVNERPEYLASYVHLTEDGNQALAAALYDRIAPLARADSTAFARDSVR